MRAAAIAWKLRPCGSVADFWGHFWELAEQAKALGADFAVFPECITLELEGMHPDAYSFPHERCPILAEDMADQAGRAKELGLTLCAGTTFAIHGHQWVNRMVWMGADGSTAWQDKLVLTQWELAEWGLGPGQGVQPMPDPACACLICYDSEFPELGRAAAESGATVLAVPAFTETWHGHWRVRHSCAARAVENQIFVIHAPLVGSLGREPVLQARGTAAILAPCCPPFPDNGLLAESAPDEEAVIVANLDLDALAACRRTGDVRNWDDRMLPAQRLAK